MGSMRKLCLALLVATPLGFATPAFADLGPSSSSAGGAAGAGQGGAAGSTSSSGGSTPAAEEDDGCSVAAPGGAKAGAMAVWLLGIGALAYGRARRRRR